MSARAVVLITETENQVGREKTHVSCGKTGQTSEGCHTAEYRLHADGTIFLTSCRNKQDLIRVDRRLVFCGTSWHCHLHCILQEQGKKADRYVIANDTCGRDNCMAL